MARLYTRLKQPRVARCRDIAEYQAQSDGNAGWLRRSIRWRSTIFVLYVKDLSVCLTRFRCNWCQRRPPATGKSTAFSKSCSSNKKERAAITALFSLRGETGISFRYSYFATMLFPWLAACYALFVKKRS
jgi:hypothetical protein